MEVSEIGLPVADVGAAVDFLEAELGLPHFSGDRESFSAVGDDRGLFIVVPVGRALAVHRPARHRRAGARDDRGPRAARAARPRLRARHRGSLRLTMVDWSLARQVARLAAGSGDEGPPQADVAALCAEMEAHVAALHAARAGTPLPAPELVGRGEWASVNLDSLARAARPGRRAARQRASSSPGPLAGALKAGAAATVAAEAGLVIGYVVAARARASTRCRCWAATRRRACCSSAPNLRKAVRELDVDPDAFHRWICAHELTHVFQFQGVAWLRDHLGGMVRRYLSTVEVRIERGAAGGLPSLPDPAQLVEPFRDGGLAALVQTREQRALMGAHAGGDGGRRGLLRARHGRDRARRRSPATRSCARRWTRAGAAAPRPSG